MEKASTWPTCALPERRLRRPATFERELSTRPPKLAPGAARVTVASPPGSGKPAGLYIWVSGEPSSSGALSMRPSKPTGRAHRLVSGPRLTRELSEPIPPSCVLTLSPTSRYGSVGTMWNSTRLRQPLGRRLIEQGEVNSLRKRGVIAILGPQPDYYAAHRRLSCEARSARSQHGQARDPLHTAARETLDAASNTGIGLDSDECLICGSLGTRAARAVDLFDGPIIGDSRHPPYLDGTRLRMSSASAALGRA